MKNIAVIRIVVLFYTVTSADSKSIPSFAILIMIHSWNNNQWKKNAFRMNFAHACSDAHTYAPSFLPLIYGKDGLKCPVPPGDRIVRNQSLELSFPSVPVFPYGHWLFVLIGFTGEKVVGIHTLELDTIPKI